MLFEAILGAAPDFQEEDLDKENLYRLVFPGKPFVHGKMDKLMSELKKILRLFVLNNEYFSDQNEENQQILWASWLRNNEFGDRFNLAISKLKKRNSKESIEEFRSLLRIAEEEYLWESSHNKFSGDLGIKNMIHHLDLLYFSTRLDLANRILLQHKVTNIPLITIEKSEEADYLEKSVFLKIMKEVNQLFQKETPVIEDFQTLANLIEENKSRIPVQVLRNYSTYLRNYCTLLIDSGHPEFIMVLHQMHRSNLESGYLVTGGKLESNSYLNIVQIAIRAKEIIWATVFTKEYRDKIHGGEQSDFFYRLNLANCLFAENKFEEALDTLPEESPTSYYHLMTRRLELKAYYELDSDLLIYKMDSFRKYIERTAPKSIAENLRTMNLNFIYILNQLSQSPPKDKARSEKILKRIEEKKQIGERAWLIEKAKGLKYGR